MKINELEALETLLDSFNKYVLEQSKYAGSGFVESDSWIILGAADMVNDSIINKLKTDVKRRKEY